MSQKDPFWTQFPPRTIQLLLFLDVQEGKFFAGTTHLIKKLEWHGSSVYRNLRRLSRFGLIERERKGGMIVHRVTERGEVVAKLLRYIESEIQVG